LKRFLRIIILLVIRLLGALGARKAARSANKTLETPRILRVRPDRLGDLIMTTPVFHALKQQAPDAHISVTVGPWSREVIERHPEIDRVLICPFPGFQRAVQNQNTFPFISFLHLPNNSGHRPVSSMKVSRSIPLSSSFTPVVEQQSNSGTPKDGLSVLMRSRNH
jgi:hypothetical protein